MKKCKLLTAVLAFIIVLSFMTELWATVDTDLPENAEYATKIEVRTEATSIVAGVPIEVDLYLRNEKSKIVGLNALMEINEDVFNPVTENDFQDKINMNLFSYDEGEEEIRWVWRDGVDNTVIASVTLTPKVTLEDGTRVELFRLYDMYTVTDRDVELYHEEQRCALLVRKENGVIEADEPLDPVEPTEPLYITTEIYKIGDDDITEYHRGDEFISRIRPNTKVSELKELLITNGDVTIYKNSEKQEVVQDNEIVGTGMVYVTTKGSDSIEIDLVVNGDVDGNGKISISDLTQLNKIVLRVSPYPYFSAHYVAADLDESTSVTVTDLTNENKIILRILSILSFLEVDD